MAAAVPFMNYKGIRVASPNDTIQGYGGGRFTATYIGVSEDGKKVAVKRTQVPAGHLVFGTEEADRELRRFQAVHYDRNNLLVHPQGLKYIPEYLTGNTEFPGTTTLVMEFLGGPNLRARMDAGIRPAEINFLVLRVGEDVSSAGSYLHGKGLVHGGIRPEIIIQISPRESSFKIADLHSSSPVGSVKTGAGLGVKPYRCPEQDGEDGYTYQTSMDAYSAGVVLGEIAWGRNFLRHQEPEDFVRRVQHQHGGRLSTLDRNIAGLIGSLVDGDPGTRRKLEEFANHGIFAKFRALPGREELIEMFTEERRQAEADAKQRIAGLEAQREQLRAEREEIRQELGHDVAELQGAVLELQRELEADAGPREGGGMTGHPLQLHHHNTRSHDIPTTSRHHSPHVDNGGADESEEEDDHPSAAAPQAAAAAEADQIPDFDMMERLLSYVIKTGRFEGHIQCQVQFCKEYVKVMIPGKKQGMTECHIKQKFIKQHMEKHKRMIKTHGGVEAVVKKFFKPKDN